MKFKYAGDLDAVDVPALGLVGVKHGDVVEASGDVAKSLDAQAAWQRVADPTPRAKKTTAKKTAAKKKPAQGPAPTTSTEE